MPYLDYTKELTGLQDIILENVESADKITTLHIKMERKPTKCPCCGELTDTVHDYRKQLVKDMTAFGNNVVLSIKKRRYRCPHCNNRIKVVKRISYGYRNFRKFRNRILHIFRCQYPERYKTNVAA